MTVWEAGLAQAFLKFVSSPTDLKAIQNMYECFTKDQKIEAAVKKNVFANEGFKKLYDSWQMPKAFTLEELLQLPEDSFGHIYAKHMKTNNLQLDFISEFQGKDVLSYMWARAKYVHDITHVLTGFDTSLFGEIAVKGFEAGQYRSPATATTLSGAILALSTTHPEAVGPLFEAIIKGYELGKRFPLLMGIQWENEWATPLNELKQRYGLL